MADPFTDADFTELRAADPVRLADLPTADSPSAQRLLNETVSRSASMVAPPRRPRRRLVPLGAAAAVLAVVAAALAILGPATTEPAVAAVKAAAQEAATADSGRVLTTFSVTGTDDGDTGTVAGTAELTYAADDFAVVVQLDALPAEFQRPALLGDSIETRIVDGVLYGRGAGFDDWVALEVPELITRELESAIDPRAVLDTVQELVEADEVGTVTIDGETLTQYRSVVDLGDESLTDSGWLAGLQSRLAVEAEGLITVEVYLDQADTLRRLDVSGDVSPADGNQDRASFVATTVFTDLGVIPPIEAPAGVEPMAGQEGLYGGD